MSIYSPSRQDLLSVLLRGRFAATPWCEKMTPLFSRLARQNLEEAAKRNVGNAERWRPDVSGLTQQGGTPRSLRRSA